METWKRLQTAACRYGDAGGKTEDDDVSVELRNAALAFAHARTLTPRTHVRYARRMLEFLGPKERMWNGDAALRRGVIIGSITPTITAVLWKSLDRCDKSRLLEMANVSELEMDGGAASMDGGVAPFVKLERANDWGNEYLARAGQATRSGMADIKALGLSFVEGAQVRVRWPDGATTTETLTHQKSTMQVSDHGRDSTVSSSLAGFFTSVHGVSKWIPLDAVEVSEDDVPRAVR